jgi:hypothetical protein
MLTTHPHLETRSRISMSYNFSPPWHVHGGSGTVLLLCGKSVVAQQWSLVTHDISESNFTGRGGSM